MTQQLARLPNQTFGVEARVSNPRVRIAPRDTQRKKVYAAENAVFAKADCKYHEPLTIVQCRALMKRIWKRQDFRRAFPAAANALMQPTCVEKRSGCSLGGWHGIRMGPYGRKAWVVVHELAHTVSYRVHGNKGHGHGRLYAAIYLRLVRMVMGAEWEKKLKESFKKHGVKYKAPRAKRVLSPEARAALIERLTIARNAKADLSK